MIAVRFHRCESLHFLRSCRTGSGSPLAAGGCYAGGQTQRFYVRIKSTLPLLRQGCWLSGWLVQDSGCPNRDIGREGGNWLFPPSRVVVLYCAAQAPKGQITQLADFVTGPTLLPSLAFPVAETVSVNCIRPRVNPSASAPIGK